MVFDVIRVFERIELRDTKAQVFVTFIPADSRIPVVHGREIEVHSDIQGSEILCV